MTKTLSLFTAQSQGGYISHINQLGQNENFQPRKMLLLEFLVAWFREQSYLIFPLMVLAGGVEYLLKNLTSG